MLLDILNVLLLRICWGQLVCFDDFLPCVVLGFALYTESEAMSVMGFAMHCSLRSTG